MKEGKANANKNEDNKSKRGVLSFPDRPDTVFKFLSRSKYGGSVDINRYLLSGFRIAGFFPTFTCPDFKSTEAA